MKGLNRLDSSAFALPFNFTTVIANPRLTQPPNGASDYTPANVTFQWQPVAGVRTYAFRLGMDSTMASTVRSDSGLPGTSVTVDSLSVSTRYFWQVSARSDSNGTTVSPVWSFTTLITVPGIPQLSSPAQAAVNLPTSVTFQWRPSLGANSYRLQISTDSLFGTVLYDFPASGAHQSSGDIAGVQHHLLLACERIQRKRTECLFRDTAIHCHRSATGSPITLWSPVDGQNDVSLPAIALLGTDVRRDIIPCADLIHARFLDRRLRFDDHRKLGHGRAVLRMARGSTGRSRQ